MLGRLAAFAAAAWPVPFALLEALKLTVYLRDAAADVSLAAYLTTIVSRLSVLSFLVVIVLLVATRPAPVGRASGIQPNVTAVLGTFLMLALTLFPRVEIPLWLGLVSTALTFTGNLFAFAVILGLGRSFSILPEARRLVTDGPYRFVRHPLYLAEEIAVIGVFLQFLSIGAGLLVVAHLLLQIQRMRNEEKVLASVFPEYDDYRRTTPRLVPYVY